VADRQNRSCVEHSAFALCPTGLFTPISRVYQRGRFWPPHRTRAGAQLKKSLRKRGPGMADLLHNRIRTGRSCRMKER
jgi:hypothetical protein